MGGRFRRMARDSRPLRGGERLPETVADVHLAGFVIVMRSQALPHLAASQHALGWLLFEYLGETVVFHSGADVGERSLALWVPERGLGVVVLANGANAEPVIYDVVDVLYDHEPWVRLMRPDGTRSRP